MSQSIVPVDAMIFHRWLPVKEEDFFRITDDGMELTLWFDVKCTWWASRRTEDELGNWVNVTAHYIYSDVIIRNLSEALVAFIFNENKSEPSNELETEYKELGLKLLELTIKYVNRLISYFKYEKAQYWLEEYSFNPNEASSITTKFKARVKMIDPDKDKNEWKRWHPPFIDSMTITMESEDKYVGSDEWPQVIDYLNSKHRPNLVHQLLANAESLAGQGHRRSSLIEAFTALEVVVSNFSEDPDFPRMVGNGIYRRIDQESFKKQVEHLGFSATLRYLLPILFEESELPTPLLESCQNAIAERGNVVHKGQRDVSESKLKIFLRDIRKVCSILQSYRTQ